MKHSIIYKVLIATAAFAFCITSCSQKNDIYSGSDFVMFADTSGIYPVNSTSDYFSVPVVASSAKNYDRTFGVEIIDQTSNAIEKLHYNLKSHSVTIPAGKTVGNVEVAGVYENIEYGDSLGFTLQLIIPEEYEQPLYPTKTNVVLMKVCPYDINDFTGYCLVSSTYLLTYDPFGNYQRVVWTEKHPTQENAIICHDMLYNGYDVTLQLDPTDMLDPTVDIPEGSVAGDEFTAFGIIRGDNKLRIIGSDAYPSYFYPCQTFLTVGFQMYVTNLDASVGTVGYFYNILEWLSEEEAHEAVMGGVAKGQNITFPSFQ